MSLQNELGEWLEETRLNDHIVTHFRNKFSTSTDKGHMEILSSMGRWVIKSMSLELSNDFSIEEIRVALKQIHLQKPLDRIECHYFSTNVIGTSRPRQSQMLCSTTLIHARSLTS